MKNNTVIMSFVLAIALVAPKEVFATEAYTSDLITIEMGDDYGFSPSASFSDLDNFSELDGIYENYADVRLVRSSSGEVEIIQHSDGSGINKARVIQSDSYAGKASITQYGAENTALIEQYDGVNNIAILEQSGYGHESYILQEGSDNYANLIQTYRNGESSRVSLEQYHGNNRATVVNHGGSHFSIKQNGDSRVSVVSSMTKNISIEQ